jgi:hypothetical protein
MAGRAGGASFYSCAPRSTSAAAKNRPRPASRGLCLHRLCLRCALRRASTTRGCAWLRRCVVDGILRNSFGELGSQPLNAMLNALRKLLGRKPKDQVTTTSSWDPHLFIYVKIPGDIQPLVRGERFEDPLEAVLEASKLGNISGGGSQLDDPYPDGRPRVEFCGIDVDVTDTDRARTLLREELIKLQAPDGTELHYTRNGAKLLDRFEGGSWSEGIVRTLTHPGFGV